jgi:hypothetical protein
MDCDTSEKPTVCPSAQPEMEDARVFGVMTGTEQDGLRVAYLNEALPVTPEILEASGPLEPPEIMRIAAPCMGNGCIHFDGANCMLATRIATMLDPVVRSLPRCAIRPTCRWFRQEGAEACFRCPQVVTNQRTPTDLQREIAEPASLPSPPET